MLQFPVILRDLCTFLVAFAMFETGEDTYFKFVTQVKGTLRRRLSHSYFSFIAKYTSN